MSTKAKSNSAKKAVKKVAKKEAKHHYIAISYDHEYKFWEVGGLCDSAQEAATDVAGSGSDDGIIVFDLGVLTPPASKSQPTFKLVKVSA